MNTIENFINRISADSRITDGIFNVENEEHQNVFQEHLEKLGATVEESLEARNKMTEGKYPDRQAYNANGILVTFPTPDYKQRALQRGTHFEKNPKQKEPNVTFGDANVKSATASPAAVTSPKPEPKPEPVAPTEPVAPPEPKPEPVAPTEPSKPSTPSPQIGIPVLVLPPGELKKREDAIVHKAQEDYVEKILSTESVRKKFTLAEAHQFNFYNKGMNWYNPDGEYMGISCYDPNTFECFIVG
jgi:hypothetical protein